MYNLRKTIGCDIMSVLNTTYFREEARLHPITHFSMIRAMPEWDVPKMKSTMHWHDYFEFEILMDGEITHILNGKSYTLKRGYAHLLRYSDFHTMIPITEERVYLLNFNFDVLALPEEITEILLNSTEPFIYKFTEEELQEILTDINILQRQDNSTDNRLELALYSSAFSKIVLTFLCKCIKNKDNNEKEQSTSRFNDALSIIQCRFRENLTLIQLADAVGLTPNYLGHQFKTQLGQNYTEYLKKVRLEHAKNLLSNSDLPISAISEYSGFNDVSYFIRCFKSIYGITPKQLIKKHKTL